MPTELVYPAPRQRVSLEELKPANTGTGNWVPPNDDFGRKNVQQARPEELSRAKGDQVVDEQVGFTTRPTPTTVDPPFAGPNPFRNVRGGR